MSGHRLATDLYDGYAGGHLVTADVGDGETWVIEKSHTIIGIRTAGAESRKLPNPAGLAPGTQVVLYTSVIAGATTVTCASPAQLNGAANTIITFADATPGETARLMVIERNDVNYWAILSLQGAAASGP